MSPHFKHTIILLLPSREKSFRMGLIHDSSLRRCSSSDSICCKFLSVRLGSHRTDHLLEKCSIILFSTRVPIIVGRPGRDATRYTSLTATIIQVCKVYMSWISHYCIIGQGLALGLYLRPSV